MAGFGATLLVLVVLLARRRRPLGWEAVLVTWVAIAAGAAMEATVFRFTIFDPVDFGNQSIGACLACACVIGEDATGPTVRRLLALAVVLVAAGFGLAFVA